MTQDPIQEIKERLPIEELVGEYLSLKRAGVHLKALCPFHAEKTPSFIVSPDRGTYHCFGCGKHGDIFSFLQEMEGVDFKEALEKLAEKTNVELPKYKTHNKKQKKTEDILFKIMNDVKDFYKKNLQKNQDALIYLKKRGFSEDTISKFELGFAPNGWDDALKYLKSKGYSEKDMERCGLVKKSEKNPGRYYDRFRARIMFPIYNDKAQCIAFSGRDFGGQEGVAKYINSPETEIYHKSKLLYGYHIAKQAIRRLDFSIVVEGQADLLAMHQSAFANTVALSGTALSDEQISMLGRFSKNIILALDADDAGVNAIIKNSAKLLSLSFNIKILAVENERDPADILKEKGETAVKELVKDAENLFDFLIHFYKDNLKNSEKYVKVLRSRVVPLLAFIDSKIEQEIAAKKLAASLGVSVESILQDAVGSEEETNFSKRKSAESPLAKQHPKEDLLFLEIWLKELKSDKLGQKEKDELLKKVSESVSILNNNEKIDIDEAKVEEKLINFDKIFLGSGSIKISILEFLNKSKEKILRQKIEKLQEKIRKAELEADENKAEKLQAQVAEIVKELSKTSI